MFSEAALGHKSLILAFRVSIPKSFKNHQKDFNLNNK